MKCVICGTYCAMARAKTARPMHTWCWEKASAKFEVGANHVYPERIRDPEWRGHCGVVIAQDSAPIQLLV